MSVLLAPTASQLQAQVRAVRRKDPSARFVGIRARPEWDPSNRVVVDGREVPVVACRSPLAFRAALVDHAASEGPVVLLTDRDEKELGLDVRARLAFNRILPLELWQVTLELFQAREWDRLLARKRWLAQTLLDHAPTEGYPPVWAGVLDADTVWRHVLGRRFGLPEAPDLATVLRWAGSAACQSFLAATPDEQRDVSERLAGPAGPAVRRVLDAVAAGHSGEVIAIGLCARVLADPSRDQHPALREAAVRLEPLLGGRALELEALRAWADAAEVIVRRELDGAGGRAVVTPWFDQAEALLARLGAREHAGASGLLPGGLSQRLTRWGEQLGRALGRRPAVLWPELADAADAVNAHELARREGRVESVAMAVRLVRWLTAREADPSAPARMFSEALVRYADDGAFVDRARAELRDEGHPALRQPYALLLARVDALREADDRRFGELLAPWAQSTTGDEPDLPLLPIEHVLARIVAPLARSAPTLLVVLDGMSHAVFRELEDDLTGRRGWIALEPQERPPAPVVGLFPTVTETCRTSLLCGVRRAGTDADEVRGFAEHPALLAASTARRPPLLVHKAALGRGGTGLPDDVHAALADAAQRVVGVVVNAVDDHLLKGDQVRVPWDVAHIDPLAALLNAARDAGRTVVLTSDHGHVLERGSTSKAIEGARERWRPDTGPADLDELTLRGPRVLLGGGAIRAPWREGVRYGAAKRHGYHGGASPAEVSVPLGIFSASGAPPGWREARQRRPVWWSREVPLTPERVVATEPQAAGPLFVEVASPPPGPPAGGPAWIDRLLASPIYTRQLERAARAAPPEERVREMLAALDARGGKLTEEALATQVGLPRLRLPGTLAALRRLLNVDGYAVLARDQETVVLDRRLLFMQFGLEEDRT